MLLSTAEIAKLLRCGWEEDWRLVFGGEPPVSTRDWESEAEGLSEWDALTLATRDTVSRMLATGRQSKRDEYSAQLRNLRILPLMWRNA
jgi:hypothetical protein